MVEFTLVIGNKNYSSWSLRPWLAMKYFGVKFDEILLPLDTPKFARDIRQYSPTGRVPILLHRSRKIWDSLAILEYLAEQVSEAKWWPEDVDARAFARSVSAEMHSGFQSLRQTMPMNCRARLPGSGMTAETLKDIYRVTELWRECRQRFGAGGAMLFGGFTIADAMFAPVVMRFVTYQVKLDPVCENYVQSVLALPAVQEWNEAASVELETIAQEEV